MKRLAALRGDRDHRHPERSERCCGACFDTRSFVVLIDDRPVVPEREAKSISHETTFEHDIADREVLQACLVDPTGQVGCRLRRHGLRGRTVQLKVRFADFSLITRSRTLPEPTDITQELWQAANELLCRRLPAEYRPVRLLGMGVSSLDDTGLIQGMSLTRRCAKSRRGCPMLLAAVSSDISGGREGYVFVPFDARRLQYDGRLRRDYLVLDLGVEQFRNAPRIERDNWDRIGDPHDPQFLTRTHQFYQRTERSAARPVMPAERDVGTAWETGRSREVPRGPGTSNDGNRMSPNQPQPDRSDTGKISANPPPAPEPSRDQRWHARQSTGT